MKKPHAPNSKNIYRFFPAPSKRWPLVHYLLLSNLKVLRAHIRKVVATKCVLSLLINGISFLGSAWPGGASGGSQRIFGPSLTPRISPCQQGLSATGPQRGVEQRLLHSKKVVRGRPRLLDESQAAILVGYILERNKQDEVTTIHCN